MSKERKGFWKKVGLFLKMLLPMIALVVEQLLSAVVVLLIFMAVAFFTGGFSNQQSEEIVTDIQQIAMALSHVLTILIFGLWYYYGCGRQKPKRPDRVFSGRIMTVTILAGIAACMGGNALLTSIEYFAPDISRTYENLVESMELGINPLMIVAAVLIAPIGEEIVCRGITFHYAKDLLADMKNRRAAFWIANTLQALIFGILHGNLVQGIFGFLTGLVLGWLRSRYNSLYPAMLAHFIMNFITTFLGGFLSEVIPEALPVYLLLTAAGAAGILLLIRAEDRRAAAPVWGNASENVTGN